ncbi:hypothetical protein ACJMK2_001878 [Sinanodonta woodiana]|uniref:Uncharacterized protein n=1 Tax=Sinanodonta woodiana TaxID=1069815 RepID=A0ABD3XWW5_SINWO
MSGSVADQEQDAISPQQKTMDQNLIGIVADYDKNTEVLDQRSQQNISQNLSSTAKITPSLKIIRYLEESLEKILPLKVIREIH